MKLIRNMRRAAFVHHAKERARCPVCCERKPMMSTRHGEPHPGTLEADQLLSGCCSDECAATFYRLRDVRGNPVCVCGEIVAEPMADCSVCRVSLFTMEDGLFIHSECLA